jgi:hypothetical protein
LIGLTQQLLGLQGCWNMAAEHSLTTNTRYQQFLRLRPDNAVFDPTPSLEVFSDTLTLYIPSIKYHCCGNQDISNISSRYLHGRSQKAFEQATELREQPFQMRESCSCTSQCLPGVLKGRSGLRRTWSGKYRARHAAWGGGVTPVIIT